jgi:hypothetical protein
MPIGVLLANLLIAGGIFVTLRVFASPPLLPCFHPLAETILTAAGITLSFNIFVSVFWMKLWFKRSQLSLIVLLALGLLALWMGSYSNSPLQLPTDNYQLLRGFLVTQQGRANKPVKSGEIILLQAGTPAGISVLTDLPNVTCRWNSTNGGALDDPDSCGVDYLVPAADYDILKVVIKSGCRAQTAHGQIKISIFP